MTHFLNLPVEVRDTILSKLPTESLLQCRRVCQTLLELSNHILNRRLSQMWSWTPHFLNSDEDEWVHNKMGKGVLSGGLPACCRRHNFERIHFSRIFTKSLVIWIEEQAMSAKLNQVVKPLLLEHGQLLTSFTLTLEGCNPKSIAMSDLTKLFAMLPNLRHFGFKVCNCSIRPFGPYQTRQSGFPPLPHLEVLDLEFNENVLFSDALLKAYGNQIKRLTVHSSLIVQSSYLSNVITEKKEQCQDEGQQVSKPRRKVAAAISPSVFAKLRELKISGINGVYQTRSNTGTFRRKFAGRNLFAKMAQLPTWRLERLSLNLDDWALHRMDRWGVAIPELVQMITNFKDSLRELYISLEYVDRSLDLSDWHSSAVVLDDEDESTVGTLATYPPPVCPNLRKLYVDSLLMETPLLAHILQGFGHVEEIQFLMWSRYDARWSTRYALANIHGNLQPSEGDLPRMTAKLWTELPSLKKIAVLAMKDFPAMYESKRT